MKEEIICSLNRWKSVFKLMDSKKDIKIVNEIINIINNFSNQEAGKKKVKETDNSKLENILNAVKEGNSLVLKDYKLKIVKTDVNIKDEWDKLSENRKAKLTKLELNVIYHMIYKPSEIKYIKAKNNKIIEDINYFIKDEERDKSLAESNLI